VNVNKPTNVKVMAALIGGSAAVAIGALGIAIGQEHSEPASTGSVAMTLGATSTMATPPATPATTMAVPAIKGPPKG
jgi:hypothetical protein